MIGFSDLPEPQTQSLIGYRNIPTIKISQDLFDDIAEPGDFGTLQAWDNETSGIDHQRPQKERAFQYANVIETVAAFEPRFWRLSRFTEGKEFGVWYGALEKETAVQETLYWFWRLERENLKYAESPIIRDLRMFETTCTSDRTVDLRSIVGEYPEILHKADYSTCQRLGKLAVTNQIGMYLTPSVRSGGGTCVPVFDSRVIVQERTIYYLHYTLQMDGTLTITEDHDRQITVPSDWA